MGANGGFPPSSRTDVRPRFRSRGGRCRGGPAGPTAPSPEEKPESYRAPRKRNRRAADSPMLNSLKRLTTTVCPFPVIEHAARRPGATEKNASSYPPARFPESAFKTGFPSSVVELATDESARQKKIASSRLFSTFYGISAFFSRFRLDFSGKRGIFVESNISGRSSVWLER